MEQIDTTMTAPAEITQFHQDNRISKDVEKLQMQEMVQDFMN